MQEPIADADPPAGASILVNDRYLLRKPTGISMYLAGVIRHWPADAAVRPVGYWKKDFADLAWPAAAPPPAQPLKITSLRAVLNRKARAYQPPMLVRRIASALYARAFRRRYRTGGHRAYFEPNLPMPLDVPMVTTCQDLSVLEHPQWHPAGRAAQWQADFLPAVPAVSHWIAISQFTADRMTQLLGVAADKITVIPLAARRLPYPPPDELNPARRRLGLPQRYLLHLGTIEPRKNIPVLLDAYAALPADFRRSCGLVVAGGPGWGASRFRRSMSEHPLANEVLATGYVDDAQAAVLLAGAVALLSPSFYEGFGLPNVEAMACGTPVICSTAPVFREVVGDGGVFIDCDDAASWAEAMQRAAEDPPWRQQLAATGRARVARYSWARTAARHAEVFARVC